MRRCCREPFLCEPVYEATPLPKDLLPPSQINTQLAITFRHKNVNLEVEDNFARAASQRRVMRGRAHNCVSMAAKHCAAEIQLNHARIACRILTHAWHFF
jgi:hypothetical protein